jgi:hypothetical protein
MKEEVRRKKAEGETGAQPASCARKTKRSAVARAGSARVGAAAPISPSAEPEMLRSATHPRSASAGYPDDQSARSQQRPVARTTCCPGAEIETSIEAQEAADEARTTPAHTSITPTSPAASCALRAPGQQVVRATKTAGKTKPPAHKQSMVARTTCCPGAEIETSIEAQEAADNVRTTPANTSITPTSPAASCALRAPGQQVVRATKTKGVVRTTRKGKAIKRTPSSPNPVNPVNPVKTPPVPRRTRSQAKADYWAEVHAGKRPGPQAIERPRPPSENPLLDLPDERRGIVLARLRDCPYDSAVNRFLCDEGLSGITPTQVNEFFEVEVEDHWEYRIGRAAQEANALIRVVERSPVKFSAAILAALGQETFRQIANGNIDPDVMAKLVNLFMRARGDERADQMQELKREKLHHELEGQFEQALERLAQAVDHHPAAREAFEALQRELLEENQ